MLNWLTLWSSLQSNNNVLDNLLNLVQYHVLKFTDIWLFVLSYFCTNVFKIWFNAGMALISKKSGILTFWPHCKPFKIWQNSENYNYLNYSWYTWYAWHAFHPDVKGTFGTFHWVWLVLCTWYTNTFSVCSTWFVTDCADMCTKTCYKFDRYLILGTLVYALLYNLRRTCQDLISDVRGTWSYWWNWWYFYLAFSMWNFAEACVPRPRYRCERFRGKLSRADAATSSSRRRCWEGDKGERVTGEGEKVAGGGERATWAALSLVEVRICIHRDKQSGDVKCCQQESFFFIEGSIWY